MPRSLPERLARLAGQGTEAVTGAVRSWAGGLQQLTGALPDPATVVDGAFDAAEQVLRAQREVALTVLRLTRGERS